MNSDDLACFARVVACGSFSRAAVELGSDQSTISRQMARLETEARTRLFHRSGRGVELTEPGRLLLAHAQRGAAALDDAQGSLQACAQDGPAERSSPRTTSDGSHKKNCGQIPRIPCCAPNNGLWDRQRAQAPSAASRASASAWCS